MQTNNHGVLYPVPTEKEAQDYYLVYSYVIFWTRISNQSATHIELKVKFPEVTFFKSPDSYIKIVLPKESMNIEQQILREKIKVPLEQKLKVQERKK